MKHLASELPIAEAPYISENGGYVHWPQSAANDDAHPSSPHDSTRVNILDLLNELKPQFTFRSFRDLGIEGVMAATDLPRDKAEQAMERFSTEPLLWDDADAALAVFRERLAVHNFSLTKGGRFWHVSGQSTKGLGMQQVIQRNRQQRLLNIVTLGIGDSPIDQSMLDIADYPIGIPTVDGHLNVTVELSTGVVASQPGPFGWAEAVGGVLDKLNFEP